MSQIETVALWAGLIASIISSVLSVVAIWFAVHVNARSEAVGDQTIRSLQKIETFVQKLSDDTSGLVKAAWDKMLGSMYRSEGTQAQEKSAVREIASGLTAELKTELEEEAQPSTGSEQRELAERLEKALDTWESALEAQIASVPRPRVQRETFSIYRLLRKLSPQALELVARIRDYHLSRPEYRTLVKSGLGPVLDELRRAGLVVPLKSKAGALVYWYPSTVAPRVREALKAVNRSEPAVQKEIGDALAGAGYPGSDPETEN